MIIRNKMVVGGLFVLTLLNGCASSDMQTLINSGEATPTSGKTYSHIQPSQVKIFYTHRNQPKHYREIGRVSANNDNALGIPHSEQTKSEILKEQAASLGANAVINITHDLENTSGDAVLIK